MAWLSISAGKQTRMRHLKEENITRDLTANFDLCLIISSAIFKKLMMWYMDYKKKNINYCKIFIYSNRRYSELLRSLCVCNLEEPVWMVFYSPSFQPCLMHMPPSETIWSIAPLKSRNPLFQKCSRANGMLLTYSLPWNSIQLWLCNSAAHLLQELYSCEQQKTTREQKRK